MPAIDPRRRFRGKDFHWQGPGLNCRVVQASRVVIDAGWSYRLGDRFWRLYLNLQDGAEIRIAGRRHALAAGRLHVIPAGVAFSTACHGRVEHIFIHAVPVGWDDRLAAGMFGPLAVLPADPARDGVFAGIGVRPWEPAEWIRLQAEVLRIFAALVGRLGRADQQRVCGGGITHQPAVASCLRIIESDVSAPLTVAGLARSCGVTPEHLARQFRAEMGVTPLHWLQRRRAEVAAELLVAGRPIAEAAARTGFANRFHFSRIFSRAMGASPSAYRARERARMDEATA